VQLCPCQQAAWDGVQTRPTDAAAAGHSSQTVRMSSGGPHALRVWGGY